MASQGKRACGGTPASQRNTRIRTEGEAAEAAPVIDIFSQPEEGVRVTGCSVCYFHYDAEEHSPLLLPCWHTFCAKCVGSLSSRQCPTCRKAFEVGEAKPNFLAQDLLVELCKEREGEVRKVGLSRAAGLLSSLVREGAREASGLECVVCLYLDKEVAATHVCKEASCGAFFCAEHGGKHGEKKPDHELCELPVSSAQLCGVHRGELRQSVCVSCTEIMCAKCSVEQHAEKGHTTMSVGSFLQRLRGELPEELATLEAALEATRRRMAETEGLAAEVVESIVEAERAADMVVVAVSEWRRETQEELDGRRRAGQAGVVAERAELEELVGKLELACDVVRGVMRGEEGGGADITAEGMEAAAEAVVGVTVGEARVGDGVRQGERKEREGLESLVVVGRGWRALEGAVRALLDGAKVRDVGLGGRKGGGGGMMLHRVLGAREGRIGSSGVGNLQFRYPLGVAVLEDGNLVVCDSNNDRLQIVTTEGRFVRAIGSQGSCTPSSSLPFRTPRDVAVLEHGNLIVCDSFKDWLQILTPEGRFVRVIGCPGNGNLQFNDPRGVAVLEDGNLVVCDFGNNRLQIVTTEGRFVRTIGSQGSGNLQFKRPVGVAGLEDGNIVVCDAHNHRLQIVTTDGRFVRTIGSYGSDHLQFNGPIGVAVLEDGNLVVSECQNHRLQIVTVSGEFVRTIPCRSPLYVAVLDSDYVAVSISDHNGSGVGISDSQVDCIGIVRVSG